MAKFAIKKSYKDGHVAVKVSMKSSGYRSDQIKMEGSADITTQEARDLAAALVESADRADAAVSSKAASEQRRKQWRDREVAAGRLKIMNISDLRQR